MICRSGFHVEEHGNLLVQTVSGLGVVVGRVLGLKLVFRVRTRRSGPASACPGITRYTANFFESGDQTMERSV